MYQEIVFLTEVFLLEIHQMIFIFALTGNPSEKVLKKIANPEVSLLQHRTFLVCFSLFWYYWRWQDVNPGVWNKVGFEVIFLLTFLIQSQAYLVWYAFSLDFIWLMLSGNGARLVNDVSFCAFWNYSNCTDLHLTVQFVAFQAVKLVMNHVFPKAKKKSFREVFSSADSQG